MQQKFENDIIFEVENITKIKELLKDNIWFNFFKTELEIESWIDFETKIEYVLNLVFSSTKLLQQKIYDSSPLEIGHVRTKSTIFDNKIEIIEILNFFKIFTWENSSGDVLLNEKYLVQKYNYNLSVNTQKIAEYLHTEIVKFKEIFNLYFETFISPLYPLFKEKNNKLIFKKINFHFTFNYTPTMEKLYQNTPKTEFLHGKIGNNNNIVLGINDLPNDTFNRIHYIPFTKYFQKLNQNTDYHFLNKLSDKSDDFTFIFYGHSLDISDSDYINEIFNFVNSISSQFTNKIVVVLHRLDAKSKLLTNLINIRGKDDIVKKMRSNTLQFILADSEDLIKVLNSDSGYSKYNEPHFF